MRTLLPLVALVAALFLLGACCGDGGCGGGCSGKSPSGTGVTPCVPQFREGGHGWR